MSSAPRRVVRRVTVENTAAREVTLILEPWAIEHPMAAGERFVMEITGATEAEVEPYVRREDDLLVVWVDAEADVRVFRGDGTVVEDWR